MTLPLRYVYRLVQHEQAKRRNEKRPLLHPLTREDVRLSVRLLLIVDFTRRVSARIAWPIANTARRVALWIDPGTIEEWEHLYLGNGAYVAPIGLTWQKTCGNSLPTASECVERPSSG